MSLSEPQAEPIGIALASLASGRIGIPPAAGKSIAEAASVCLDERGHSSPTEMAVYGDYEMSANIDWIPPSDQAKRWWNDDQYATEHGAYCIAALIVEQYGLEIVERSKKKTGFDFWLGPKDAQGALFQDLTRLEVSGVRDGNRAEIESRVKQKINQTKVSDGVLPAVIVVVEFGGPIAKMVERCKR